MWLCNVYIVPMCPHNSLYWNLEDHKVPDAIIGKPTPIDSFDFVLSKKDSSHRNLCFLMSDLCQMLT